MWASERACAAAALAALAIAMPGCAVVTVAGATVGAAVSITGAVVGTGVKLTGKAIGKTFDVLTPDAAPGSTPAP